MSAIFTTGAKIGFFGEYIYLCQDINLRNVKRIGIFLLSFLLLVSGGCRKYEQIRIVSGKVESLNMSGFRSADIVLKVEVSNPAGKVVLEEASGVVKHFGKVLGRVSLAPLELRARWTGEYRVEAKITLDKGVSFMDMMSMMDVRRLRECTVDISAKGKASGVKVKKQYDDIPLKKLLEDHNNEKI